MPADDLHVDALRGTVLVEPHDVTLFEGTVAAEPPPAPVPIRRGCTPPSGRPPPRTWWTRTPAAWTTGSSSGARTSPVDSASGSAGPGAARRPARAGAARPHHRRRRGHRGAARRRAGRSAPGGAPGTLLITSSPALLRITDRVVVIADGRVAAEDHMSACSPRTPLPRGDAAVTAEPRTPGRTLLPVASARQTWTTLVARFRDRPASAPPRRPCSSPPPPVDWSHPGCSAVWWTTSSPTPRPPGSPAGWRSSAAAAVLTGLLTALGAALASRLGETVLARLRERVLDRALHLPSATLERAGTGDLLARVGDDVAVVTNVIAVSGPAFVGALLSVVLTVFGLVALDWRLGLARLVAAPAYALALRWYLRRSMPYYARERVATGERTQAMAGALRGAATVRARPTEDAHVAAIAERSGLARDLSLEIFNLHTRFGLRINRSEFLGLAAVLVAGFLLVRDDLVPSARPPPPRSTSTGCSTRSACC
ncbi:ABC transporter ATP-binding protein [Micromonospora sp. BRA006-A]|nr:ABC transporter ATP-binding protein [Micromonospora sp. BRA006-A]